MSTNFDEAQKSAMAANLSADGELGEAVQILKRNETPPRDVYVVANRNAPVTPEEFAEGIADVIEVTVKNDSTSGIAMSEFGLGDFMLRIAPRKGGTVQDYPLPNPSAQNAGSIVFRVGRSHG